MNDEVLNKSTTKIQGWTCRASWIARGTALAWFVEKPGNDNDRTQPSSSSIGMLTIGTVVALPIVELTISDKS
jgi:hypothetical protein